MHLVLILAFSFASVNIVSSARAERNCVNEFSDCRATVCNTGDAASQESCTQTTCINRAAACVSESREQALHYSVRAAIANKGGRRATESDRPLTSSFPIDRDGVVVNGTRESGTKLQ
jgi:hypothetical protein